MVQVKLACVAVGLLVAGHLWAQSSESGTSSAFTFEPRIQGSYNSLGAVTRLDATPGYIFNSHWSVAAGIPYYFVSPSSSTTATTGASAFNGLGDVYAQVRLTILNPTVNYVSTVTGTAPTGDRSVGLSTGHATVDWSNYFDHSFGRFTPFAEIGIANAISDTQFFIRPYTSYGFVAHVQAGGRYRLARWLNAAASGYAIEGSGQQTIISRIGAPQKQSVPTGAASAIGNSKSPAATAPPGLIHSASQRVFETNAVTTGSASLARDEGFSGWLQFGSSRLFNLYVGYTRSTRYDLNTLFFGIGTSLRKTVGGGI
jgi:hypothetical protein